jgi:hypothetical protein
MAATAPDELLGRGVPERADVPGEKHRHGPDVNEEIDPRTVIARVSRPLPAKQFGRVHAGKDYTVGSVSIRSSQTSEFTGERRHLFRFS